MRFSSVSVRNFRAIRNAELADLADVVLVAGPNGCGKSALLDAIRLLKSQYRGYQYDEATLWFNEFQIELHKRGSLTRVLRDPGKPLELSADLTLHDEERAFLDQEAEAILEPLIWRDVTGGGFQGGWGRKVAISTEMRLHGSEVKAKAKADAERLRGELEKDHFTLAVKISPTSDQLVEPCIVAEAMFQTYAPEVLGDLDYHGAQRSYVREGVGGAINLQSTDEELRANSLYNWQSKFQNIKSELASSYVREMVAERAGIESGASDLNETLDDLFRTFFPNKSYAGPRPLPDGTLEFPVTLRTGETHDIDELSSGEKEILYGYLRLRNMAPKNSILLLDEPELHLNPGLLQGLADFYYRHLGKGPNNQLWLITHSDALLRQGISNPIAFSTFHLRMAGGASEGGNQAVRLVTGDEFERAIIDLVGDLASYKPRAKVVILEGGGQSEFDVTMVSRLFPEFAEAVNLISGGGREQVRDRYRTFSGMAEKAGLSERFYAITDRDSPIHPLPDGEPGLMNWPRYHIENYLLEPEFIAEAMQVAIAESQIPTSGEIEALLKASATRLLPRLVLERLRSEIDRRFVRSISIDADRSTKEPARDLVPSVAATRQKVLETADELLQSDQLLTQEKSIRNELEEALASGSRWLEVFPGRAVLASFVTAHVPRVSAANFNNLIIDQMASKGFQPAGMADVLNRVENLAVLKGS